ncbi:MAG: lysophospholipid acyltransferase family protein [Kiritimatiellia bacterium]
MSQKKYKTIRRMLRRPFEWTGIYLASLIIPCLTLRGCDRLAACIAHFGMFLMKRDKAIASANLKVIYGNHISPYREKVIIYHSFRNMSAVLVKLFWISRKSRRRIEQMNIIDTQTKAVLKPTRPAIYLSAHIGNWEILSQCCILHGVPIVSVAKNIGSTAMTRRLRKIRSCIGQKIVSTDGALKYLVTALKNNSSLGLLIDQHTSLKAGGTWLKFFGISVDVSISPATLARKLNLPIIVAWSRPLKNGHYRIEHLKTFEPDPLIDDRTRSQEIMNLFEKVIRRHPSFWTLNYRRWRTVRPSENISRYPFYARPEKTDHAAR